MDYLQVSSNTFLTAKWEKQTTIFSSYDSLTIYDGGSSTSPMMGKYCGDSIPPSHVSSSNEVLIHFQSNNWNTEAGFKMEYNPIGNTKAKFFLKRYDCGDSIPPSHVSSSNEVLIQFQSDGSVTEAGFQMGYNPTGNTSI